MCQPSFSTPAHPVPRSRLPGAPWEPACLLLLSLVDGSPEERGIFQLLLRDLLGKALPLLSPQQMGWQTGAWGRVMGPFSLGDGGMVFGQENKEEKKGVGSLPTKATSPSVLRSLSLKGGEGSSGH